eukprot:g77867.t1
MCFGRQPGRKVLDFPAQRHKKGILGYSGSQPHDHWTLWLRQEVTGTSGACVYSGGAVEGGDGGRAEGGRGWQRFFERGEVMTQRRALRWLVLRWKLTGAVLGGFFYVLGGMNSERGFHDNEEEDSLSSVERFNVTTNRWEQVSPMAEALGRLSAAVATQPTEG